MKINETLVITDPCYLDGHSLMERRTIYGDWSCMVYKGDLHKNKLPEEWDKEYFKFYREYNSEPLVSDPDAREKRWQEFSAFKKDWLQKNCLGEFCADAGMVAVFKYDSLSVRDKQWIEKHPWCAAVIKDFNGDVEFVVEDESVYVVGRGNFNFFSTQSGL